MKIVVGRAVLIVNRADNGLSEQAAAEIAAQGLELAGLIPQDPLIAEYDSQGRPTYQLPADSPALRAAYDIFAKLIALKSCGAVSS